MELLRISLIQSNLIWENPIENRTHFSKLIATIENTDLIVLPEMFTTGFSMHPENFAEPISGTTITWMQTIASKQQVALCGSLAIYDNGQYFNRFVFVTPSKELFFYDKRHLFTLAGEHRQYTAGQSRTIITYKGWNICPQICYDLRFTVWSRYQGDYDVLLYVANWPKPRIAAWDTLLKARAIENMSYTIGVNRVGMDPNQNEYTGSSALYDALGEKRTSIPMGKEAIETITISKKALGNIRSKFNFLNDRDAFTVAD